MFWAIYIPMLTLALIAIDWKALRKSWKENK